MNGGPHPTPDKALLEWSGVFGPQSGDTVNGLQAVITPESSKVKPGEDIQLKFELQFKNRGQVKNGEFAQEPASAFVWDGKYSNGYRNHGFQITTPAGKTLFLQPTMINNWDKNAPHRVEVKEATPYVLPGWGGPDSKSLKALGLDTSAPGMYTIIGVYAEIPAPRNPKGEDGTPVSTWGGKVTTAPVTVKVEP
jgi:hypothetical protein